MGVSHVFKNLSAYFQEVDKNKLIINDIARQNIDNADFLNYIMTIYDTDVMSTVPKCECPDSIALKGRPRLGTICSECGCPVREVTDKIDNNVWLRGIYSSEYGGIVPFISPGFWMQFSRLIYSSPKVKEKVDYLRWLCDTKYRLPAEAYDKSIYKAMEEIVDRAMDGKRGYVNFIRNIDRVFQEMINHKEFKKKKNGTDTASSQLQYEYELYKQEMRERKGQGIFSNTIPILNKNIFVMEKNPKGKFCPLLVAKNISVVKTWIDLCRDIEERQAAGYAELDLIKIGNKTAAVISALAELYNEYNSNYLYKKPGILRKHFYGARLPFTFRGVIISRYGPHDRHGVEVCWSVAVTIFRTHLKNKMHRDGLNVRECNEILNRAPYEYTEYVHQLLEEIMSEFKGGKAPVMMQRNPSLTRSSILKLYIDKIYTDPKIKVIAVSQLIVKFCNGDYDGDQTNFLVVIDEELLDALEPFNTKYAIPSPYVPFQISKYLTLLSTGNYVVSELLQDRREDRENDTISHLLEIIEYKE